MRHQQTDTNGHRSNTATANYNNKDNGKTMSNS